MNQQQITELIVSAVGAAISAKKTEFEAKLSQITGKLEGLEVPHIEEYKEITINNSIRCDESLDLVKTLPEFDGKIESYVSWRQAANNAQRYNI